MHMIKQWSRKWKSTLVLPGKFHGQGSLEDYSPWGYKDSDMTEKLNLTELIYLINSAPPINDAGQTG